MKVTNDSGWMPPLQFFATIAAAVFLGGSGTVLVHHLLEPTVQSRVPEDQVGSGSSDSRVGDALIQIAKELHELRSSALTAAEPSTGEAKQRTVATESGESALSEIATVMRELRSVLEAASARNPAMTSQALSIPRDNRKKWLPEVPGSVGQRTAAYTQQHLFWTEQQVLDTYGLPGGVTVSSDEVQIWNYFDPDTQRSFSLRLSHGRVIGVENVHGP